jgi:hypothetical protein
MQLDVVAIDKHVLAIGREIDRERTTSLIDYVRARDPQRWLPMGNHEHR